jgi:transcriptional regulator with XRE-family HTH domain
MKKFGEKLRFLRTKKEMTLKELARAIGFTSHGYLSEIEAGKKKPTAEFVVKVARYFNVTTDSLMKDELNLGAK